MENFNLKKFLVENKLTSNSKTINEIIQSDPETITQAFQKAGVNLNAPTSIKADYGHAVDQKNFSSGQEALAYLEDMRAEGEADNPNYNEDEGVFYEYADELASIGEEGLLAVNFSDGASYFIMQEKSSLGSRNLKEGEPRKSGIQVNGKIVEKNSIELDDVDHGDRPDYSDAYISYAEFEDGTELSPKELDKLNDEYGHIASEMLNGGGMYEGVKEDYAAELSAAKKEIAGGKKVVDVNSREGNMTPSEFTSHHTVNKDKGLKYIFFYEEPGEKAGTVVLSPREALDVVKAATGTGELPAKAPQGYQYKLYAVHPAIQQEESARDRRIVEMVQRALGIPTPISEDEMVQENPLPKYSSIDELMKEIEHGTNETAHKYKMDKMKSVYEALESKVGSLEEGEHAEHINPSDIKQMRKDIAALRKAEEKLRKEYDKKFAKKEKPSKKEVTK